MDDHSDPLGVDRLDAGNFALDSPAIRHILPFLYILNIYALLPLEFVVVSMSRLWNLFLGGLVFYIAYSHLLGLPCTFGPP